MRTRVLALLYLLLAAAPSALAQKNGDDVSIGKSHTITSKVLGEERTVLIHLPDGYEASKDKYPVLYVLGGSAGDLVEGVQATSQRGVPPMIVVAIATTGYRLLQLPQGWAPQIPDWPRIVEAAKGGKSDPRGPRKRPASGAATR